MSDPDAPDDDEKFEVYRGPKMGYDAPKERVRFVARVVVNFFGSPFIPKNASGETIHRFVQSGSLSVSSKSARLDIQMETTAAEMLGAGIVAAAGGQARGGIQTVKVKLPRKRVERVVIDRKNKRVAIKASAENDDGEVFKTGWIGMAIRSFPDDLVPALQEAFGDKVQLGPLKTDMTRTLVMLAVLVALLLLGLIAVRPF